MENLLDCMKTFYFKATLVAKESPSLSKCRKSTTIIVKGNNMPLKSLQLVITNMNLNMLYLILRNPQVFLCSDTEADVLKEVKCHIFQRENCLIELH